MLDFSIPVKPFSNSVPTRFPKLKKLSWLRFQKSWKSTKQTFMWWLRLYTTKSDSIPVIWISLSSISATEFLTSPASILSRTIHIIFQTESTSFLSFRKSYWTQSLMKRTIPVLSCKSVSGFTTVPVWYCDSKFLGWFSYNEKKAALEF